MSAQFDDKMFTLREWVTQQEERLKDFIEMFEKGQKDCPELFPDLLPPGEWDEQFVYFKDRLSIE